MLKSSLLYKIINGIWDMCYIWKTEMRNVFRDEGVLIFCVLVPLGYPLLYSWIYNNEVVREVDTAIVDLSHTHTSREFIRDYGYLTLFPGLAIMITVLVFNLMGDGLRDALDPKLKQ